MENIIHKLENIKINHEYRTEELIILRESSSCINFQKCLMSPQLLRSFNIHPGDIVSVQHNNSSFILKTFENNLNINTVEVYGIVENIQPRETFFKLEKIDSLKKFSKIVIDLVCFNSHLFRWLSLKQKLIMLLETRILRNLLFCEESTINFDNFPETLTLGLKKVLIVQTNTTGVGFISPKTKIVIRQVFNESQWQNNTSLMQFFGADRVIREFTELIDLNIKYKKMECKLLPPIKQVLLAGPSGCGKSSLLHKVCRAKTYPLVRVLGQDIHSKNPGESEKYLRDVIEEVYMYVTSEDICILLLEDIDVICPNSRNVAPHTARLSAQLLQLLDRCQQTPGVVVIGTTNKPAHVHPGLRRHGRLSKEILLGKPSENERLEIISNYLQMFDYFTTSENIEISKVIASITPGYLGADLKLLCQTACTKISTCDKISENKLKICKQIFKEILLEMKPASLRNEIEVVAPGTSIALGGLSDVKRQLELSVRCSLLQPHVYLRMGIQKPRGILLYGPPGCAKTSLVKSLAATGNITVLYATNASIYSPYVGDAEKAIVNLFHNARQNTPAVIFIDEIDSLVGSRCGSNSLNDVQERVLAALLTQMDGIAVTKEVADDSEDWSDGDGVMVIAATNRPNEIDPALLRPGRFDRHLYIPPPDEASRRDILSIQSKNTPLHENVDLNEIARRTQFYSGADLKNLHKEAVLYAMQKEGIDIDNITQCHYEDVLKVMKPSLSTDILQHFQQIW